MPVYVMQDRGGTQGAKTGTTHRWSPGDEIEAPEGEFRHLSPGSYETRPMTPESNRSYDKSGSWKYLYVEGEEHPESPVQASDKEVERWVQGEIDISTLKEAE